MDCPICGSFIRQFILAKHLPHFFRCPDCSGYYNDEKNSDPTYHETYFADKNGPTFLGAWISRFLDLYLLVYERKIKKLVPSKNSAILDYGCGKGKMVAFLKKRGFRVAGYDPSASALNLAQKDELPVFREIPDTKYDLVMFWHSLEHTDQPLRDLERLKRYLTPNAKLLIAVPNGNTWEAHIAGSQWFNYDWPFHRIHFNRQSLKKMLNKIGFKIVAYDYWSLNYTIASLTQSFLNLFFAKNLLYNMVSNRRFTHSRTKTLLGGVFSLIILLAASPFLLIFFMIELLAKRTGAMIVIAEPMSPNSLIH